jgi:hypothetical protein
MAVKEEKRVERCSSPPFCLGPEGAGEPVLSYVSTPGTREVERDRGRGGGWPRLKLGMSTFCKPS